MVTSGQPYLHVENNEPAGSQRRDYRSLPLRLRFPGRGGDAGGEDEARDDPGVRGAASREPRRQRHRAPGGGGEVDQ